MVKLNEQMIKWAFPEKNCTPCWGFFWSWPPWISSQIYRIFFLHWQPWKTNVFSSSFGVPPGIQTTFTLPPWNFPLISSTGVLQFFSGKAQYTWRKIIMVKPNEHYDQGALVFRQDRSQRIITILHFIYLWMLTQGSLLNSNELLSTRVLTSLQNTYKGASRGGGGRGIELGTFQSF